jgi:soluble lytic murein transglycosylase-like protein
LGALNAWIAAFALVAASPVHADSITRWRPYVDEASTRFGVPAAWIEQVMRAESGGLTTLNGRPIISRAGAMGLMQLMPGTWAEMRAQLQLGAHPHDPHDNIIAGTRYLRLMYDRFGYPGCFAAYNAGPARYASYLAGRSGLPGETIGYLANVAGPMNVRASPTAPILFVVREGGGNPPANGPQQSSESALFFVRRVAN